VSNTINTVLVTGALGHIGSGFIRSNFGGLDNVELLISDNLATQRYTSLFNLPPHVKNFHQIDSKDTKISELIQKSDLVIHLSAITDATSSFKRPKELFENNLNSTKTIVDLCGEYDKFLVFPSSTSVYGSQETRVDENSLNLNPQSPYAECKIQEEEYILDAKNNKFISLRLGTVHGVSPGMRFHTAVNKFCFQAAYGQNVSVWKSAHNQVRPYLSLGDLYVNLLKIISNPKIILSNKILNVVSRNLTPSDILSIIREVVPDLKIEYVEEPIMNQFSYEVANDLSILNSFEYGDSIREDIFDTIKLLRLLK
jgi:UDP-glucose 4-epimerase